MGFVTIEDETQTIELVVFPNLWQDKGELLELGKIIRASGRFDLKEGQAKILAEQISPASDDPPSRIKIIIANGLGKDRLLELKQLLAGSVGDVPVELEIRSVSGSKQLKLKQRIALTDELLDTLSTLVGQANVLVER